MIVTGRVIFPERDEDVQPEIDDLDSRLEDAVWAGRLRLPFTWQRWLNWFVCRRWLLPRDVRKR
jgi:hypothetical protein